MSPSLRLFAIALAATTVAASGNEATDVRIDSRVSLIFASRADAAKVLSAPDDFVRNLSSFDRAARIHQAKAPTEPELLAYLGRQALDWSPDDVSRLKPVAEQLAPKLAPFAHLLPDRVLLVKATNSIEDGEAHTRQDAIVLPEASLRDDSRILERKLAHELFHVVSRSHPDVRDQLYAIIGFLPCRPLALPAPLRDQSITNPDAPRSEHAIKVQRLGRKFEVVPILQASPPSFDPSAGKSFFAYVNLRFLPVERTSTECRAVTEGGRIPTFGPEELSGFIEQVGRNTQYIIHPEEILADNFAITVLGPDRVPSPLIPERIRAILQR